MACEFQILFPAELGAVATDAAIRALDLVAELEEQLSLFRPDSELCRLNRAAGRDFVPVEPRLFALLSESVDLFRETDGAFDITSGPLWRAWRFDRRQGRIPSATELADALQRVGSNHLVLDPAARAVRFGREGMELNLAAIGKGYALDRCAELLVASGVTNFLIHGGQSSILGRGVRADVPWKIALKNPLRPAELLGEISIIDQALGTSGSGVQYFFHEGRRFGHLIDPRTGQVTEGVLSVTVSAPTAARADALATAFFVMGQSAARRYCESHPEIGAIFVEPAPRSGEVLVSEFGPVRELPR